MSTNRYFDITNDYRLTSDRYQFIVEKKSVVSDEESENFGKETWAGEAYLPKIEDVVRFFLDKGIKDEMGNIHAVAAWVNEVESKFAEFMKADRDRKESK